MFKVQEIIAYLTQLAPPEAAAPGDNVGLLLGDPEAPVVRLMTALTLSADVAQEAIAREASLVVVHHPVIYRPISRIVTTEPTGRVIWQLAKAGISVYCPHTAWDSAALGINQQWAERLGLVEIAPLDSPRPDGSGTGRFGRLPLPARLGDIAEHIKQLLRLPRVGVVGEADRKIVTVGIACGSGAELIPLAADRGCDALVTGELTYHRCLLARALGMAVILVGHFASERFAMERLAELLAHAFPQVEVWCSRQEKDPVVWV